MARGGGCEGEGATEEGGGGEEEVRAEWRLGVGGGKEEGVKLFDTFQGL